MDPTDGGRDLCTDVSPADFSLRSGSLAVSGTTNFLRLFPLTAHACPCSRSRFFFPLSRLLPFDHHILHRNTPAEHPTLRVYAEVKPDIADVELE
jgi:hypothetical protein